MAVAANGDLVVAGLLNVPGFSTIAPPVARWDGVAWSVLGGALPPGGLARSLVAAANGDIVVGSGNDGVLARSSGAGWSTVTSLGSAVIDLVEMPNGDLVACGTFTVAGGVAANNIARWNGITWAPLGSGLDGPAYGMLVLPNGDLVAVGAFTSAGGAAANSVARWDGTSWSPFGGGIPLAAGESVFRAASAPNGDLYVVGRFAQLGGVPANSIARWDGSAWQTVGGGLQSGTSAAGVSGLAVQPNGRVVVGGGFTTAGGVAAPHVAVWDGSTWAPLGAGLPASVNALVSAANGDLVLGSQPVLTSFPPVAVHVWRTPCPASSSDQGGGCAGSGGANQLTTTALPWAEATFRAQGTGLPAPAIVVALTSVTAIAPPFPLTAVFAQAVPGCNLLVAPDIVQVLASLNGTAESSLFLSNVPAIAGLVFYHQMVPFEVDALGNVVAITASNVLQLTAGQL
ncbi:MAG: hypothetical protein JNL08_11630 [Planctomycetes bacterium]|nr:hypothetical protein [Planctomycetota bacterium]